DSADERKRNEKPEQGQAGNGLEQVGESQYRRAPRGPSRKQNPARDAHHDGDDRRARDQRQMLSHESQDFPGVAGVETPETHAASMNARHSGLSDLRNSSGVPRNTSFPCCMRPMRVPSISPSRTSCVTNTIA